VSKYLGTLNGYWRLKDQGTHPAPCPADPERTFEFYPSDVFTRMNPAWSCYPADVPAGYHAYTKQTGLCVVGILLPDDAVEYVDKAIGLELV
jgi:hypothetical protein